MLHRDVSDNQINDYDVVAGDEACTSCEQNEVSETVSIHQSIIEESISATITSIQSALQRLNASGDYSVFVSREVIARPPFPYFYGLVRCIDKARPSLGWTSLLSNNEMVLPQARKEKVSELSFSNCYSK